MSALTVDFDVDPELKAQSTRFKTSTDRALLVGVDNERLVFLKVIPGTQSETVDMSKVRTESSQVHAAFIIFRRGTPSGTAGSDCFALITYVSDEAKPKLKMMMATAARHLRTTFDAPFTSDKRVTSATELTNDLFKHEASDRDELMTEKERAQAHIAKLLRDEEEAEKAKGNGTAAPPRALPGMAAAIAPAVEAAIKEIAQLPDGACAAAIIAYESASATALSVTARVPNKDDGASVVSEVVSRLNDTPCFAFVRAKVGTDAVPANYFLYFCPGACKPKDKMRYSASKGSLLGAIRGAMGLSLKRSLEFDDAAALVPMLHEAPLEEDSSPPAAQEKAKPARAGFALPGMGPRAAS